MVCVVQGHNSIHFYERLKSCVGLVNTVTLAVLL